MDLTKNQLNESLDRVWNLIEESGDQVAPVPLEGALQEALPLDN